MWRIRDFTVVSVLLICIFVKTALGCGGYGLVVKKIENCIDNGIVTVSKNFTIKLDRKCNIIPIGCYHVHKDFNDLSLKFTVLKKPFVDVSGYVDVCELTAKRSIITSWLTLLGLPSSCPVSAQNNCYGGKQKFNIWFLKPFLSMAAGPVTLKLEGKTDSGDECLDIEAEITG